MIIGREDGKLTEFPRKFRSFNEAKRFSHNIIDPVCVRKYRAVAVEDMPLEPKTD